MALSFAKRIIGYGAWNLHFDKTLGADAGSDGLPFLSYLRAWGYYKVNHIKVILFRKPTVEGLPPERALTLYRPDGSINQALIDNLKRLVAEAAAKGFWVQICIWHHHAIADGREYPDDAPAVLAPNWLITNDGLRLSQYYAPVPDRQAAFAEHRKLFSRIGKEFGAYGNVIFELGNELRVRMNPTVEQQKDELHLRSWLASMLEALRTGAAPNAIRVCTSTGINNESLLFTPPTGLAVDFFDFHAGQWGMDDKLDVGYPAGIGASRTRVRSYKPGAKLLIDTDGLFRPESFATSWAFAQEMEKWATEAFRRGESFITKGYYPPGVAISRPMLDALERASNAVPET